MFAWYLKISRPRFWIYLLGPFLIGLAAAPGYDLFWPLFIVLGLYFTFPANLLIYGVNDINDYETDKHNPKKQQYELLVTPDKRHKLVDMIRLSNCVVIPLLLIPNLLTVPARLALLLFLLLGVFYSAPPIRAKARPLLDTLFNALYIMPGVLSYAAVTDRFPPTQLLIAATLWCMAMHAYSAVPDIKADRKASLSTVATWLGARYTLLFCLVCYLLAAVLSFSHLGAFSVISGLIYVSIMIASLLRPNRDNIFKLYRYFPYLNMAVGAGLFFWVITLVK